MLSGLSLPASWRGLLEVFAPVFARRSTFGLFMLLATGLVGQTRRRTVVGMLAGARATAVVSFHAACRFFSRHAWQVDRLGLATARLIVDRLLPPGAPIVVAVDDTLFRRWGRRVHHALWTHDAAAQRPGTLARGNRWVIAGIVVQLPFCSRPTCLPVLFGLWAGKGTATPVQLAARLLELLAGAFPDRIVHGVGDAYYRGRPLLVPGVTWTCRLPVNAVLYARPPAGPRVGTRGRPRLKGAKLGNPHQLAATARWQTVQVRRYGHTHTVQVAAIDSIWYGAFGNTLGRTVLARDLDRGRPADLAVFTTDPDTPAEQIITRYADRWTIETAIATGKQTLGVGQARNRVARAVDRTVPFGLITQSLVVIWYTTAGHHPDDLADRRARHPWYQTKTEPAFEDMLAKLRRVLTAARFMPTHPSQLDPAKIRDYTLACQAAAA